MGSLKKILSFSRLQQPILDIFQHYRYGEAEGLLDFYNSISTLIQRAQFFRNNDSRLGAFHEDMIEPEKTPAFARDLFEICRQSEEGLNIFFNTLLPSFQLHQFSQGITLWANSQSPAVLNASLDSIREGTELLIQDARSLDSNEYEYRLSRSSYIVTIREDPIIQKMALDCRRIAATHRPRVLSIGAGAATECQALAHALLGISTPIFFNVDQTNLYLESGSNRMARFDIPNTYLTMDAHDFSTTRGLSSALMPKPDIVLVRHFQILNYPSYPYAGLRSLSGTNGTAFVTFFWEDERNLFLDHLASRFEPDSLPTTTSTKHDSFFTNHNGEKEYIVQLNKFPKKSFVYKGTADPG